MYIFNMFNRCKWYVFGRSSRSASAPCSKQRGGRPEPRLARSPPRLLLEFDMGPPAPFRGAFEAFQSILNHFESLHFTYSLFILSLYHVYVLFSYFLCWMPFYASIVSSPKWSTHSTWRQRDLVGLHLQRHVGVLHLGGGPELPREGNEKSRKT